MMNPAAASSSLLSPPRSFSHRFTNGFALAGYVALVRVVFYLIAAPHYGDFSREICGALPIP